MTNRNRRSAIMAIAALGLGVAGMGGEIEARRDPEEEEAATKRREALRFEREEARRGKAALGQRLAEQEAARPKSRQERRYLARKAAKHGQQVQQ